MAQLRWQLHHGGVGAPVGLTVFKTAEGSLGAVPGGFDSHTPLPEIRPPSDTSDPFSCRLIALNTEIWYGQRVTSSSHTLIKEKLMSELRTCHLPHSTVLFCIGGGRLGPDTVVPSMAELEGRR